MFISNPYNVLSIASVCKHHYLSVQLKVCGLNENSHIVNDLSSKNRSEQHAFACWEK